MSDETFKWTFYDFQSNWDAFWHIWQSDKIQKILKPDMENWCQHECYFERGPDGSLVKPTWKPKSDLWRYSRTDFHCQRMLDRVNDHVEKDNSVNSFIDAKRRFGMTYADFDAACNAFWKTCSSALFEMYEPRSGSWEAQILMMGANYLTRALYHAAQDIFPGERVVTVASRRDAGSTVIIPARRIVFDFVRAFHHMEGTAETPNEVGTVYDDIFSYEDDDSSDQYSDETFSDDFDADTTLSR